MNASTFAGNDPRILIRFDGDKTAYLPGEVLSGEFSLERALAPEVQRLKLAVLWRTEGKGDEASAVHHAQDVPAEPEGQLDPYGTWRFQTQLPPSPLSYEGFLLKVCWCVRVEAFLSDGQNRAGEVRFRLGTVAAFQPTSP